MNEATPEDPGSGFGGLRHRMRYRFDNLLARGTTAALLWLGAVTIGAVLLSSLLLTVFGVTLAGSNERSWLEDFWQSLLRTLDSGTMASDVGWGRRLLALAVTVFGLLVAGTLIGIIASGVEGSIERMRRGRSVVIENDHIVVLGTSERLPVLVQQLTMANEQHGGRTIVILADQDPAEMHDAVEGAVADRRGSRIVYRNGDPTRRSDLELVRLAAARTVIVLAGDDGDAGVVKATLAVGAELGGFDRLPIVVEVVDPAAAVKLQQACGAMVHPILTDQAMARVASYALRDAGIGKVVSELLDFGGSDIYVRDEADLEGVTFREIVHRFASARPIGRVSADGLVSLNPAPESVFAAGDRLVVVADDDGVLERSDDGERSRSLRLPTPTPGGRPRAVEPAHMMVVGWSDFGTQLVGSWAQFAAPGSTVEVVVRPHRLEGVTASVETLGFEGASVTTGDAADRITEPAGRPAITTVLLLCDRDLEQNEADARVLLELAVLRAVFPNGGCPRFMVEVLDVDSIPLVELTGPDDYLVSDTVASQFIAQLAEQPERRAVMLDLYFSTGPSLRLETVDELGLEGEFEAGAIFSALYDTGKIAIGWRRASDRGGELTLNPPISERVELLPGDSIISIW